ncbi:unnamed protein product, partial [Symbiodinium sp. KB8]
LCPDKEIINALIADKYIPKWEGKACLWSKGTLSKLQLDRCGRYSVHLLLDVNHKVIEDMEKKTCELRQEYVELKEEEIEFGDVEFEHLIQSKDCVMMWEWAGIIQRGRPETVKIEWKALGCEPLRDGKMILHTESAKSYKLKLPEALHDNVVHCKKREKVNGIWQWQRTHYVRIVTHRLPGTKGKTLKVIDRCWRFLEEPVLVNQHTKAGCSLLRAELSSAQYEYCNRYADIWVRCGDLCDLLQHFFREHALLVCLVIFRSEGGGGKEFRGESSEL